jgi:hypothetical protein
MPWSLQPRGQEPSQFGTTVRPSPASVTGSEGLLIPFSPPAGATGFIGQRIEAAVLDWAP